MEADETRTNQSANLMVASLAGSLAHVTCKVQLKNLGIQGSCLLSLVLELVDMRSSFDHLLAMFLDARSCLFFELPRGSALLYLLLLS